MTNSYDDMLNVVGTTDKKAAFIEENRNNRSKCYEIAEKMTEAIVTDGSMFQMYLDTQSRFDRYTPNNVLLIMAQRPDAQKLGDYGYWKDQKAFVRRNETSNYILIMEPGKEYEREDGSIGTYYNAKKLYDISQTTFKEKEQPVNMIEDRMLVRALVNNPPVSIISVEEDQLPDNKGAVFFPSKGCICVRKGMNAHEIFRSLVPELIFAEYADGDRDYDRAGDLFYAECTTYMLCKKYGVDTNEFDFSCATEFFDGMEQKEVRNELSKIRDSMNAISSRMVRVLEGNREMDGEKMRSERREARG